MSTHVSRSFTLLFVLLLLGAGAGFAAAPEALKTTADPAMVTVDGTVFMVYRGADTANPNAVFWAAFDGQSWSDLGKVPAKYGVIESPADVALAVYRGQVIMVYQGVQKRHGVYWAQLDPRTRTWSDEQLITPALVTVGSPALATLGDTLYLTYQGEEPVHTIYWASYDGQSWTNRLQVVPAAGRGARADGPAGYFSYRGGQLAACYEQDGTLPRTFDESSVCWTLIPDTGPGFSARLSEYVPSGNDPNAGDYAGTVGFQLSNGRRCVFVLEFDYSGEDITGSTSDFECS